MTRRAIGVSERPPLLQTIPLSLQHLFAMFGATVLVPILFHINPATVLLFNGIGTLLYLFICKGKIPAYLGIKLRFYLPGAAAVAAGLRSGAGRLYYVRRAVLPRLLYCQKSRYRLAGCDVPAGGDGRHRGGYRPRTGGRGG